MNKPKREHHVTPKLYLKGFVIAPRKPFIWVYKKNEPYNPGKGKLTNNPFNDSINIAGVERDFYANPGLSGSNRFEAFENDLEALEKPANKILPKLVAGQPLSVGEKAAFAAYIIQFSRRGAAGRETINSMLSTTAVNYEPPDQLYQLTGLPKTSESRMLLKARALAVAEKPGYPIHMHQGIVNASSASFVTRALNQMNWHLIKAASGSDFVTCDNPVFFDKSLGLGSSMSEVSFPVSCEYTLFASWWKLSDQFVMEVGPDVVELVNQRTIHNSVKHVYSSKCEECIVSIFGTTVFKYRPISPAKENFKVMEFVLTGSKDGYIKQLMALPLTAG